MGEILKCNSLALISLHFIFMRTFLFTLLILCSLEKLNNISYATATRN